AERLSTRAMGAALGIGQATVRRDLHAGEPHDSPADAHETVVGADGKSYPSRLPITAAQLAELDPRSSVSARNSAGRKPENQGTPEAPAPSQSGVDGSAGGLALACSETAKPSPAVTSPNG